MTKNRVLMHYAGTEGLFESWAIQIAGWKYNLGTVYPFIAEQLGIDRRSYTYGLDSSYIVREFINPHYEHTILDSGIFTIVRGSHKGDIDEKFFKTWFERYVDFIKEYTSDTTSVVELDLQSVLDSETAWKYRRSLKKKLPEKSIINVFHLVDGIKGLKKLIDYSDYIAFSVREYRRCIKDYKKAIYDTVAFIKKQKPNIRIHILGLGNPTVISNLPDVFSVDSTTWEQPFRFGQFRGKNISHYDPEILQATIDECKQFIQKKDPPMQNEFTDKAIKSLALRVLAARHIMKHYDYH